MGEASSRGGKCLFGATVAASFLGLCAAEVALGADLALHSTQLALPGAPAAVLSGDLDRDGVPDLVVVVAKTSWGEIGVEERTELTDAEGLVEVMTVVPALLDEREVHAFLAQPDGSYRPLAAPLPLPASVLSLESGTRAEPFLVLTDEGISVLRLDPEGALGLEPWIADPPVLAGSGSFLPGLRLVHDLDGDGEPDLFLPGAESLGIYLGREGSLSRQAASRITLPFDERLPGDAGHYRAGPRRHYPLPEVLDVDGDGLPDLAVRNHQKLWNQFQVLRGLGGGRFGAPFSPLGDRDRDAKPEVVYVGDLDGDHRAEIVMQIEPETEPKGMRAELKATKRPRSTLAIHRLDAGLRLESKPVRTFPIEGYSMEMGGEAPIPGGFEDLDGDGRKDLITVVLDFSVLQVARVLATRRIGIGLDYRIHCQRPDGSFQAVTGLDLSGKFQVDFDDLRLRHRSLFDADFDGDGRRDFVQLGRGKTVTIHRGREGCRFPAKPDLSLELAAEPPDLSLVNAADLDGDGRTDLWIAWPETTAPDGSTLPVRLEVVRSAGGRSPGGHSGGAR